MKRRFHCSWKDWRITDRNRNIVRSFEVDVRKFLKKSSLSLYIRYFILYVVDIHLNSSIHTHSLKRNRLENDRGTYRNENGGGGEGVRENVFESVEEGERVEEEEAAATE